MKQQVCKRFENRDLLAGSGGEAGRDVSLKQIEVPGSGSHHLKGTDLSVLQSGIGLASRICQHLSFQPFCRPPFAPETQIVTRIRPLGVCSGTSLPWNTGSQAPPPLAEILNPPFPKGMCSLCLLQLDLSWGIGDILVSVQFI